jgi:hypothetical protein
VPRMSYIKRVGRFDTDLAGAAAVEDTDTQQIALLGRAQLDDRERTKI